jgi:hypothetical protein
MVIALIGIVALVALCGWVLGGVALRAAGIFTTLAGLLVMIVDHSGTGLVTAIAGVMLWLAGHWHFAVKHHHFRSPLARRIFAQLPPTLDPTRASRYQVYACEDQTTSSADAWTRSADVHKP